MIWLEKNSKLYRGSALFIMDVVVAALIGAIFLGVSKVVNLEFKHTDQTIAVFLC